MPRTRSLAWSELKIGILTVFALIVSSMLIFAVGGGGGFFWQNYPLKAVFPNVAGIKSGSPVRVAGVEVGSVEEVRFAPTGVEVWFQLRKDMRPLVTNRSLATIGSVSLLGEGAIDITAVPQGTPLQDWSYVPSGRASGTITELTEEATAGLNEAKRLLEDVRAGKGTVGRLFTDDAVYREVEAFVSAAERVASSIAKGQGTIGRLSQDPRLYEEIEASMRNLNEITGRIRSGEGSLGQLVNDPAFAKSLTGTTTNLEQVTERLNRGEGTAGKLLTDRSLYDRLDSMAARLDLLTTRLNEGQGTAGQLLQDKQLYENMNEAAAELRSLIGDIRKDPKRYLNVKVSIF
jgi:phospholipid/cholesterol/gamma-HCH transport system substrate-binding protein